MTELLLTPQMAFEAEVFETWEEGLKQRLRARSIMRPVHREASLKVQRAKG